MDEVQESIWEDFQDVKKIINNMATKADMNSWFSKIHGNISKLQAQLIQTFPQLQQSQPDVSFSLQEWKQQEEGTQSKAHELLMHRDQILSHEEDKEEYIVEEMQEVEEEDKEKHIVEEVQEVEEVALPTKDEVLHILQLSKEEIWQSWEVEFIKVQQYFTARFQPRQQVFMVYLLQQSLFIEFQQHFLFLSFIWNFLLCTSSHAWKYVRCFGKVAAIGQLLSLLLMGLCIFIIHFSLVLEFSIELISWVHMLCKSPILLG